MPPKCSVPPELETDIEITRSFPMLDANSEACRQRLSHEAEPLMKFLNLTVNPKSSLTTGYNVQGGAIEHPGATRVAPPTRDERLRDYFGCGAQNPTTVSMSPSPLSVNTVTPPARLCPSLPVATQSARTVPWQC
jgi:hypothetical protein